VSRTRAFRAQTHIVFWTVACILPMLAGALFATWRLADSERQAERTQIVQTAQALSAAIDMRLEKALAALQALATSPALAPDSMADFYAQCAAVAQQHHAWIILADNAGRVLLNTAQPFGSAQPPLTRPARAEQTIRQGRYQISGVFQGLTERRPQAAVYMPVFPPNGGPFVLIMSLTVDEVSRTLAEQNLPDGWTASVADRDGLILARSHSLDQFAGKPVGEGLRARIATTTSSTGTYYGTNREGTQVLAAFALSSLSGWATILGIPVAEVNAPLLHSLLTTGIVTLIMLAIGVLAASVIGRRIARRLRELCDVALSAARGVAPAPTRSGIVEFNDVAASLERAATLVEQRSRELALQTKTLSMLVDNLPIAVSLLGPDRRFLAFNHLFLEDFGIPAEFLKPGDGYAKFMRHLAAHGEFGPGDPDALIAQRLVSFGAVPREQFEHKRPNGRIIDVRVVRLPDGGFVTTRIDVTEPRRRESELEQARERLERHAAEVNLARMEAERARIAADAANTAKSLFLANMSHELRTPLNAILGFSDIVASARMGPLEARYREYGRDINLSGEHLLRLINDLLDQSRIEVGQLELRDEDFVVSELVEECRHLLAGRADDGRVAVATSVPPGLPQLRADRVRIKQILLNLVSNAVKFTAPGGTVHIAARRDYDGLALVVADSGIGMKPEDIPTALEPFRQVDSSLTRRYEGAGLGLSLARALAELHGGRLEIESEVGKGTTATVWLPAWRFAIDLAHQTAE
jgi:signal transduction histidine kinase